MFNAKPVGGTVVSNVAVGHKAQRSLNMLTEPYSLDHPLEYRNFLR